MRLNFIKLGLALAFAVVPLSATTTIFGFQGWEDPPNNPANIAIGEAQLFVEVTDLGTDGVDFTFLNVGPGQSTIANIYFSDQPPGVLSPDLTNDDITSSANVSFVVGGAPPSPPGFAVTDRVAASAPAPSNGVQNTPLPYPGAQFVTLNFSGASYAAVLSALGDASLRIGLHVISFADGNSEWFVNDTTPIPEPGFYGLVSLMLGGLFLARRKFVFARN